MSGGMQAGTRTAVTQSGRAGGAARVAPGFWFALTGFLIIVVAIPAAIATTVVATFARSGGDITPLVTGSITDIGLSMEPMLGVYMWMVGVAATLAIAIGALTVWGQQATSVPKELLARIDVLNAIVLVALGVGGGLVALLPIVSPKYWAPVVATVLFAEVVVGFLHIASSGARCTPVERLSRSSAAVDQASVRARIALGSDWREKAVGVGRRRRFAAGAVIAMVVLLIHAPVFWTVLSLPWPVPGDGVSFALALTLPAFALFVGRLAGCDRSTTVSGRRASMAGGGAFGVLLFLALVGSLLTGGPTLVPVAITTTIGFVLTGVALFVRRVPVTSARLALLDRATTARSLVKLESAHREAEAGYFASLGAMRRAVWRMRQRRRVHRGRAG